jgi:transposase
VSVLKEIDATFAARGIPVKPVSVMKAPIERVWSILKMRRRKGRLDGDRTSPASFEDACR